MPDDFDHLKRQKDAIVHGATMADLTSDRALVCHRDKVTSAGAGTVWSVMMADGYLLDCGIGPKGHDRAEAVAAKLNA